MLRICSALVLAVSAHAAWADITGAVRVIDGDTIDVGDTRVRLHAVDAPERAQSCVDRNGTEFACGLWVSDQVAQRFEGRVAICQPRAVDQYDRIVATCQVAGTDMGQAIVQEGWAFAYRRYGMDYDLDEKAAYVAGRGLHRFEVTAPAAFRQAQRVGQAAPDPACAIKGNVSGSGRIYHVPGQEHYAQTRISEAKGERWFCSEAEALAAGWRPARR